MRVFVKNAVGDSAHEMAHEFENDKACGDNGKHNDEVGGREEDKFEKVTDKRNDESSSHDADDSEEEAGTKFVKRARDPVNED